MRRVTERLGSCTPIVNILAKAKWVSTTGKGNKTEVFSSANFWPTLHVTKIGRKCAYS